MLKGLIILIVFYASQIYPLYCQNTDIIPLTAEDKKSIVKNICTMIKEKYVLPETAEKIATFLEQKLSSNSYDTIVNPKSFAEVLTRDIQESSKDLHLKVRYSPSSVKSIKENEVNGPNPEQEKRFQQAMKYENYGIKSVQRLGGNIGYIDLRELFDAKAVGKTIAHAMGFLENTDAIIFDLRMNGGGEPSCVQLICSYLFNEEPVHLNDLYNRPENKTTEYWTLNKIEGKRKPDIPVYLLTSSFTFSAAEEFAYNLKSLGRAVIVGEKTRGGAHPGGTLAIDDNFVMFIPMSKAVNPVTKTNWEGTGVTPDVEVSSVQALEMAQILALRKLYDKSQDESDKAYLKFMAESIELLMSAPVLDENTYISYTGKYGERKITYESGNLYYRNGKRPKILITNISEDLFMIKDLDYVRIQFDKNSEGKIISLTEIYDTGDKEIILKNE